MTAALPPARVVAEFARLGPNEWVFVREGSRADRCSVNRCPLDPLVELRVADPLDREKRCTVSKPDRERFFSRLTPQMQALLPYGGLFKPERDRREAGRRLQARLTPEQREKQAATLRAYLTARVSGRDLRASRPTALASAPDTSAGGSAAKAGATGGEPA